MDFKVNNISPQLLKKAKELATNAEKTPGGSITQNEVEQLLKEANRDGKITVSESQFIAGLTSEQNVKKLLQSNFNPVKGEIQFQGVSRIRLREIHQKAVTINNATTSLKLDIQNLRSGTDGNIPQDMQARIEYVLKDLPNHNAELAKQLAPLLTKESMAMMATVASAYGLAHASGVPWLIDGVTAGVATAGAVAIGVDAGKVASHLIDAYSLTFNAENEKDLKAASNHLAKAISITGVDAFLSFTTVKAGQIIKSGKNFFRPGYNYLKAGAQQVKSAFSSLWPQQWTPALATGGSPLKSPNMMMAKDPSKISQTSGKSPIERVFDETGQQVPFGFKNPEAFKAFQKTLDELPEGTSVFFEGSAVTGKKYTTGAPFDSGRVSDFDISLVNDNLFIKALDLGRTEGFKVKSPPNRIGPLTPKQIKILGLENIHRKLESQAGRDVHFVLYENTKDVFNRNSIWVK